MLIYERYTEKNPTIVNFPMKNLDMSPYCDNHMGGTVYNLLANIRHNGTTKDFWYNLHVLQKNTDKWYDIQDLIVEEAMPPLIALSEAYIQIYERVPEDEIRRVPRSYNVLREEDTKIEK